MTIKEIKRYYSRAPFQPFSLKLADGRAFRMNHPEFMMLSPGARIVHLALEQGGVESIDLLLVVSIELHPVKRGGTNGRKRRMG